VFVKNGKERDKKIEVVVLSRYKKEGFTADSIRLSTKRFVRTNSDLKSDIFKIRNYSFSSKKESSFTNLVYFLLFDLGSLTFFFSLGFPRGSASM